MARRQTAAVDKATEFHRRGLLDPNILHQSGELNMGIWDGTPNEDMPWAAQGERVKAALQEIFDHNMPQGAPWRIGTLVEDDIPEASRERFVMLQVDITRRWDWWTEDLAWRIGLINYEGVWAWGGRGGDEPHFIVFKPERDHQEREQRKQQRIEDIISPPELQGEAGVRRVADVQIKETQHKVPFAKAAEILSEHDDD